MEENIKYYCLFTNSFILSFQSLINLLVIFFYKNSINLYVFITSFSNKSHSITQSTEIENITVYFLNTACDCVFITQRLPPSDGQRPPSL